jgi:hypothetical protein
MSQETQASPSDSKKILSDLPSSKKKEFWGDAEITLIPIPLLTTETTHFFEKIGGQIVCTSCPSNHMVPIDPQKYRTECGRLLPI